MIIEGEPWLRLAFFGGVFLTMALWEIGAPRRSSSFSRRQRWPGNLGTAVINTLLQRALVPAATVGIAAAVEARGWGLWPALPALPGWVVFVATVLLLDLTMYWQHRLLHAVPTLWRLHRMHHADLDFDFTTGLRFHPFEIVVSLGIRAAVITALGAPAAAVLTFEVILNAASMFNHGNVTIAPAVDRGLRRLVVTPDMHRVHHSAVPDETNRNFGFNLSWWDYLFRSYRAQPARGHDGMTIGIEAFRSADDLRLDRMLVQPFRRAESCERLERQA